MCEVMKALIFYICTLPTSHKEQKPSWVTGLCKFAFTIKMLNYSAVSVSLMPRIDMDVFMQPHQEYYLEQREKLNCNVGKSLSTELTTRFCYLGAPSSVHSENYLSAP